MLIQIGASLRTTLKLASATSVAAFTLDLITNNYSWIDRSWSISPVIYCLIYAIGKHFADPRTNLCTLLIALWGIRLTFNFARKGGYQKGGEDYRWAILRKKMHPLLWQFFHVLFICIYQSYLICSITFPMQIISDSKLPLHKIDYILASLFAFSLFGEFIADQQQWNFHQKKQKELLNGRTPRAQFCETGLFRYCRHPNFVFEQMQWWILYLFSVSASKNIFNWTIIGPFLLSSLFVGSTWFTEKITKGKYPEYELYQRRVPALYFRFSTSK